MQKNKQSRVSAETEHVNDVKYTVVHGCYEYKYNF